MSKDRKLLVGGLCLVAIFLALLPGLDALGDPSQWLGRYNPSLAVLTLTLIAVILYAAFTFELVEETREMVNHVGWQTELLQRQVEQDADRLRRERLEHRASQIDMCLKVARLIVSSKRKLGQLRESSILWKGIREGPAAFTDAFGDNRLHDITSAWKHELVEEIRPLATDLGPPVEDPLFRFVIQGLTLADNISEISHQSTDFQDPEGLEEQLREEFELATQALDEAKEKTETHLQKLMREVNSSVAKDS